MIMKYSCLFPAKTDTIYYAQKVVSVKVFCIKKRTPKARNAFFIKKQSFLTERLEFLFFLQLQEIHAAFKVGFGVFQFFVVMRVGRHIEFAAAFLGDEIWPFDACDIVAGIGARLEVDLHAHAAFGGTREQLTEGFVVHHIENGQMVLEIARRHERAGDVRKADLMERQIGVKKLFEAFDKLLGTAFKRGVFFVDGKADKMQMGGRNDEKSSFSNILSPMPMV